MYYVYAIGLQNDLVEPWLGCYVGVTNDLQRRWSGHSKSTYTVGNFIRFNKLTYKENMVIIASGTEEDCFEIEASLRPLPFIGLNEASGGRGGNIGDYTDVRNKKISIAMKNRHITWNDKISQTRKSKGLSIGVNNPNSKVWKILDPHGVQYTISGSFGDFCKQHNIMGNVMVKYLGQAVPPPSIGGYGGFRPKSRDHAVLRENTIGWMILEKE